MNDFFSCTNDDFRVWLSSQGEKPFAANQIFDWVYNKGVLDWDRMSNLRKELRDKCKKHFLLPALAFSQTSDTTFVFTLQDGNRIEAEYQKPTLHVASQVGSPPSSHFFAGRRPPFKRSLRMAEIVEQVFHVQHALKEKISGLNFDAMGEPLKNCDAVFAAIQALTQFRRQQICITTIGITDGLQRLADEVSGVKLALQLHASNQRMREKMIPYAKTYPLDTLLKACDAYADKSNQDITYLYTLIEGVNDHPDHAFELAQLLKKRKALVALSPLTPQPGSKLAPPSKKAIKEFRSVLYGCKIANTLT